MDCNFFAENLYDYIDDNLPKAKKLEMEQHMASCPECKELVDFERKIKVSLSGLPQPKIPMDFLESINQRVNINERKHKIFLLQRILKNPVTYSAIAACFLLVVILNVDFSKFRKTESITEELTQQVEISQQTQMVSETGNNDVQAISEMTQAPLDAIAETPAVEASPVPTVTPKPTASPKPTPTATRTPIPATPIPQQPVQSSVSAPVVPEVQQPATIFDAGETTASETVQAAPESANATPSGGGSSSTRVHSAEAVQTPQPTQNTVGRITVKEEQFSDAKRLAAQYGNYKNHIYEMSASEMNQFLSAMKNAGISYVDRASGTNKFRLVSE